jgi:hypothetical protein
MAGLDLHNPEAILADPQLAGTLDLSRPVGLLLIAVLHFLGDGTGAYRVVAPVPSPDDPQR